MSNMFKTGGPGKKLFDAARERRKGSAPFTGITPPGQPGGPDNDGIPGTPNKPRVKQRGGVGPRRTALSPK